MKKYLSFVLCAVILTLSVVLPISAQSFGIIGSVLSTDIRAYINGYEVPAYNVDGHMVVVGSDLRNYGFDVVYNDSTRTSSVTMPKTPKAFDPLPVSTKDTAGIGVKVMNVYATDIRVLINGVQVQSYNVDNRMAFAFNELKVFGEYKYDNAARTTSLKLSGKSPAAVVQQPKKTAHSIVASTLSLSDVPAYSGTSYVLINKGAPEFASSEITAESFELYSALDSYGRCGTCYACIGKDLMPTSDRESISSVHPSGWQPVQYDIVENLDLYNRCHLIGFQLTGENDNDRNLINGTRYMNTEGMLPWENRVANYVRNTGGHCMYRVTPMFEGTNLVAAGVHVEARSVEDNGKSVNFNVFVYNIQPGVEINYATGASWLTGEIIAEQEDWSGYNFVLNTKNQKIHLPTCSSVKAMSDKNKQGSNATLEELISWGYAPCGECLADHKEKKDVQTPVIRNTAIESGSGYYILNTNTHKFHYPDCKSVKRMSEKNKQVSYDSRDMIIASGYDPCGNCCP